MIRAAGDVGIVGMWIVKEGNIPDDWCKSWMVSIYIKGKGMHWNVAPIEV
jgi:hypothetical protein